MMISPRRRRRRRSQERKGANTPSRPPAPDGLTYIITSPVRPSGYQKARLHTHHFSAQVRGAKAKRGGARGKKRRKDR